jgi:hypothetical protein
LNLAGISTARFLFVVLWRLPCRSGPRSGSGDPHAGLVGRLPLSLVGESLFSGIDAFALTAVPLFILTGDALVRTGSVENSSTWPKR